jgi:hypothetical protein
MNPSAYNNGQMASDFQIDMIFHGLLQLENIQVQQLPENPLMFKECPKEWLKQGWGKSFTLYGLLDGKGMRYFPIDESDLVIIGLHHTQAHDQYGFYRFTQDVINRFNKKTICVDGHDFSNYSRETANLCLYFKRELEDGEQSALPIFFATPEQKFYKITPDKTEEKRKAGFSSMIPANFNWDTEHTKHYHKWDNEEEYYQQYRDSYFGLNCRKANWQCGRLGEIVANNCLPWFTDIERMPKNTWHNLPRDLLIDIKRLKGVYPNTYDKYDPDIETYIGDTRNIKPGLAGWVEWDKFNLDEYYSILKELKSYFLHNLTTKALAKYILEKSI